MVATTAAFTASPFVSNGLKSLPSARSSLNMVLEKPATKKEISKLEILKVESANLRHPLKEVCFGHTVSF